MTLNVHSSLQPVFDGHNDLLLRLWLNESPDPLAEFFNGQAGQNVDKKPEGHLDLPRMKAGGFAAAICCLKILALRVTAVWCSTITTKFVI